MVRTSDGPLLHLEGTDDVHVVRHVLIRHGVDYDGESWPPWYPSIQAPRTGGKSALLKVAKTSIAASSGHPVGFVMDANASVPESWRRIAAALRNADVRTPERIPREGFVGASRRYRVRVGVWRMPDNEREGTLEGFLGTLIAPGDPLFEHAQLSTGEARRRGARFRDAALEKAVLHAWLAWQEEPGLPYGSAIRARFFRAESEAAGRFAGWFRRLFEPSPSPRRDQGGADDPEARGLDSRK